MCAIPPFVDFGRAAVVTIYRFRPELVGTVFSLTAQSSLKLPFTTTVLISVIQYVYNIMFRPHKISHQRIQ